MAFECHYGHRVLFTKSDNGYEQRHVITTTACKRDHLTGTTSPLATLNCVMCTNLPSTRNSHRFMMEEFYSGVTTCRCDSLLLENMKTQSRALKGALNGVPYRLKTARCDHAVRTEAILTVASREAIKACCLCRAKCNSRSRSSASIYAHDKLSD